MLRCGSIRPRVSQKGVEKDELEEKALAAKAKEVFAFAQYERTDNRMKGTMRERKEQKDNGASY